MEKALQRRRCAAANRCSYTVVVFSKPFWIPPESIEAAVYVYFVRDLLTDYLSGPPASDMQATTTQDRLLLSNLKKSMFYIVLILGY